MCNAKINYVVSVTLQSWLTKSTSDNKAFGSFKERYQNTEYVQFYRRNSQTVEASAARCPKKTLN